jgi:hypothetical protein
MSRADAASVAAGSSIDRTGSPAWSFCGQHDRRHRPPTRKGFERRGELWTIPRAVGVEERRCSNDARPKPTPCYAAASIRSTMRWRRWGWEWIGGPPHLIRESAISVFVTRGGSDRASLHDEHAPAHDVCCIMHISKTTPGCYESPARGRKEGMSPSGKVRPRAFLPRPERAQALDVSAAKEHRPLLLLF